MAKICVAVVAVLLNVIVMISAEEDVLQTELIQESPDCTKKATKNDIISMHYVGKLLNGNEFDSSYSRNEPFQFKLGAGMVIPGWEQGVPGMCVGEKRKLTVPPALAYGDQGFGDIIPAKSTLVFDIELIDVKKDVEGEDTESNKAESDETPPEHEHPDSFEAIDADKDKQITREEMSEYIKKFNEDGSKEYFDNIDTVVSEIFQEDDKNKDGIISFEEYQHFEEQNEENPDAQFVEGDEEEEEGEQKEEKDEL